MSKPRFRTLMGENEKTLSMTSRIMAAAFILLLAATAAPALSKTPPEVLKPYKAYRTALASRDFDEARVNAKAAWEEAEERLGDSRLTGDLAYNYGAIIEDGKADRDQIKAVRRSMELVGGYEDDAPTMYLERGIKLTTVMDRAGKLDGIESTSRKLVDYAEENGLTNSTFYAEALTMLAGKRAARGKNKDAMALAKKATDVFERADDGISSAYPLQASLYTGYAYEGEEDHLQAALSYQKVMEATDGLDPEKYELVGTTLGRWIYMRSALRQAGKLEDAEQQGLCQCWPYDKPRDEDVKPTKRVPPVMPRYAQQSGYVVVEFDLSDDGKPVNERVIAAWPDYYEEPALKSMKDWEYTPREPGQSDEDRTDLVTTINFRLTDEAGRLIW